MLQLPAVGQGRSSAAAGGLGAMVAGPRWERDGEETFFLTVLVPVLSRVFGDGRLK